VISCKLGSFVTSLLGKVDHAAPVDNLRRCGAVIARFRVCCSKARSNCDLIPRNR